MIDIEKFERTAFGDPIRVSSFIVIDSSTGTAMLKSGAMYGGGVVDKGRAGAFLEVSLVLWKQQWDTGGSYLDPVEQISSG